MASVWGPANTVPLPRLFWRVVSKIHPAQSIMSSPSSSKDRLASITAHISALGPTQMVSSFNAVPLAPTDPLFGLMAAYKADTFDKKVDLGVGAYRDDNAKPWILPVVKKVGLFVDPVFRTYLWSF